MFAARGACGIVVLRSDVFGLSVSIVSLATSFLAAEATVGAVAADGNLLFRLRRGRLLVGGACVFADSIPAALRLEDVVGFTATDGVLNLFFSFVLWLSLDAESARSRAAFSADIVTPCIFVGPPFILEASEVGVVKVADDILAVAGDLF